tara:strand:+ start:633 stop:3608 length:2976 start_codon:yes stop_codon:yes gene_type:complete
MADTTRNIFSLSEYSDNTIAGEGISVDNIWVSPSYGVPFAYLAGGRAPGPVYVSVVDKLSFGSDSVARSPSANLDIDRFLSNPVSSSTAAYWMTGQTPGPGSGWTNQTSKTTYTTDTTAASPNFPNVGPPYNSLGWESLGSTAIETAGYIGGGMPTPMYSRTYLFKLNFSTDGYSQLPSFPEEQGQTGDALGNQTHGYWSGGIQKPSGSPNSYGAYTRVVRFTYATDTFSNVGTLPGPRKKVSASGNATEGYIYGGIDGHPSGSATWHSTVIKLTYSTNTTSLNPSNLSQYANTEIRGSGNLSNGYLVGASNPATSSNISKFDYSTGTQSSPAGLKRSGTYSRGAGFASSKAYGHPGKFPTERWKDGASETMNKGYFASDTNGDSLYSLEMSTDSAAIQPGTANMGNSWKSQGFSDMTNGWWCGGSNPGGTSNNYIVKTPYATDTTSPSIKSMVLKRRGPMAAGNMTHGRITGGFSHGPGPSDRKSDFEKFTYSTESSASLPSVNLPQKDSQGGGSGNQELGYFTGGEYSYSWYFKVTYSNDTGAQVPSANQSPVNGPSSRSFASTLANFRAGAGTNSVQKVPFSTDTFSLLPSVSPANLSGNSGGAAANRTHGYYTHAGWSSYFYKMSFATETAEQLTTYPAENGFGTSLQGQSNGPVTTNTNVETPTPDKSPGPAFNGAIWMGGYNALTNQYTSTGGKINFSTDAITNLPSTNLAVFDSYQLAATSSPVAGYYGQATGTTEVVKVDYATNSPSILPGGISGGNSGPAAPYDPRRRGAAFGLKTAGYFMQGSTGWSGNLSNLDKVTYSSDTSARLPGSSTPTGSYATIGASNQIAGYQTGGTPGGGTMRKMPFATESWGNAPGANFPEMWDAKSMSNATHGYFIGGSGNANGTRVYKLTFATDSTSQLPTNFPQYSRYGWGTGNSTHGYASGGVNTGSITTNIYKLQYSNDTWSTTPNRIQDGAIQENAAASARQNGNGDTAANSIPNVV